MSANIQSRNFILDQLKRELIGPAAGGQELDCNAHIFFKNKKESFKSFVQKDSGEEILQRDSPTTRYGAAALYPLPQTENKKQKKVIDPVKKIVFGEDGEILLKEMRDGVATGEEPLLSEVEKPVIDSDEPDLSSAHKFLPNSMAVTFQAEILPKAQVIINFTGGRYRELPVKVEKEKRLWWAREAVEMTAKFNDIESVIKPSKIKASKVKSKNAENLNLSIEVFARPTHKPNLYTITAIIVNRTEVPPGKMPDAFAVFQSEFSVRVVSSAGNRHIVPYTADGNTVCGLTDEEQSIALLYRQAKTYAVGHGCAADWDREVGADEKVKSVIANHFPVFEVPRMTSEVKGASGQMLEISMEKLAGLITGDNGIGDLAEMLGEYEGWINRREKQISTLPANYLDAANQHVSSCRKALARMRDGLSLLGEDDRAREAFRLANHAILMQQFRSKQPLRHTRIDPKTNQATFSRKFADPDFFAQNTHLGKWRAFQIAFLAVSRQPFR